MDIASTLAATSDQIDAADLTTEGVVVTVTRVSKGSAEQPVQIHVAEFDRPWRPGKTVRRIIAQAWGTDGSAYVGRRAHIYRDPEVTYGRDKVGGVRVRAMSDLPEGKPMEITLMVRRGQYQKFAIEPLATADAPTEPTAEQVAACTDDQQLRDWWGISSPERQAQIQARAAELKAATEPSQGTLDEAGESS